MNHILVTIIFQNISSGVNNMFFSRANECEPHAQINKEKLFSAIMVAFWG